MGELKGDDYMLEELLNGNYYIYQISDGGCGIVKAKDEAHANAAVVDAYKAYFGTEYNTKDIQCTKIDYGIFGNMKDVIELGWAIELN